MSDDPFEGIETTGELPAEPSDEFMAEVAKATTPKKQPMNDNLIRGLKVQMVRAFVQYLKENSPGDVSPELEVTLRPITYPELDKLVEGFLGWKSNNE